MNGWALRHGQSSEGSEPGEGQVGARDTAWGSRLCDSAISVTTKGGIWAKDEEGPPTFSRSVVKLTG